MVKRLLSLLALCMIATACGSSSAQTSIDQTPDQLGTGDQTFAQSGLGTGVQTEFQPGEDPDGALYGASVDEWLDGTGGEQSNVVVPNGYEQIQWEDLIPQGYGTEEILARFDEELAAVQPGTLEAEELYAEIQAEFDSADVINEEVDGQNIFLAGFVAPLTYEGDLITEFLLVPFFGACIHVPAPPENQTIMITLPEGEGMTLDESWSAIWVTGTMSVNSTQTEIGSAGYSISNAQFGLHQY